MTKARRHYCTLAEFLEETETSEVALGRDLHVHQSTVSQWKTGARVPRPDLALKLHALTGVPLAALLRGPGRMEKKKKKKTARAA